MKSFKSLSLIESHSTDPQSWIQLMSGEIAGLEGIYIRFSPGLFRYGMAIKSNRSFIKDCIQELFVDLWKYQNSVRQTDYLKLVLAWIKKKLILQRNRLAQTIRILENWNGVKFIFQNKPDLALLLPGIYQDETLENAIGGLSYTRRFDFKINEDIVTI
jgi:DNA-directed RNA polymerase specialized sigma24 family protein